MKFPNHIILDVSQNLINKSNQYWILKYITSFKIKNDNNSFLIFPKKFIFKKENLYLNKLFFNQKKFTFKYNLTNVTKFYIESKNTNFKNLFNEIFIKKLFKKFNAKDSHFFKINLDWSLFDINFLRKEKMYTKLKYSRVPQYDIVSGGSAALLAGFLGFLISEKFGFELVDSGDFYFIFMYVVFLFFFCRLLLKIMSNSEYSWNIISLKWLFVFFKIIIKMIINKLKNLLIIFK